MKLKKSMMLAVLGIALFCASYVNAGGWTVTENGKKVADIFRQDNDKLLDFAIASSVEGAFYYGNAGRKGFGGQVPIVFLDYGIVSGDLGFVTITEDSPNEIGVKSLGQPSLAPGVSIRVNRILEVYFPNTARTIKDFNDMTYNVWDKLFFGPAYSFVTETKEHIGWFKCGFKLF